MQIGWVSAVLNNCDFGEMCERKKFRIQGSIILYCSCADSGVVAAECPGQHGRHS